MSTQAQEPVRQFVPNMGVTEQPRMATTVEAKNLKLRDGALTEAAIKKYLPAPLIEERRSSTYSEINRYRNAISGRCPDQWLPQSNLFTSKSSKTCFHCRSRRFHLIESEFENLPLICRANFQNLGIRR
jgi:hypothetical protein